MKLRFLLTACFVCSTQSIAQAKSPSEEIFQVCKEILLDDKTDCISDYYNDIKATKSLRSWKRYLARYKARKKFRTCKIEAIYDYQECLSNPPIDLPDELRINLDSLENGQVIQQDIPSLRLTGSIQGISEQEFLLSQTSIAEIDQQGNFVIDSFLLEPGNNQIELTLYETTTTGPVELETLMLNVTFNPIVPASLNLLAGNAGSLVVNDLDSTIAGSALDIPAGATNRDLFFALESNTEYLPNTPFEFVEVSEPVSITPIGEAFNTDVTFTIAYDSGAIPSGVTPNDLIILADSDDGWVELPTVLGANNTLTTTIGENVYDPFIVVAPRQIGDEQIIAKSNPAHATIYVDGINTLQRTPAIIDISRPDSDIKLFLDGFNETFDTVDVASLGNVVNFELTQDQSNTPEIILNQDLGLLSNVTESLLELSGSVNFQGAQLNNQTVIISLNGVDSFQETDFSGQFEGAIALRRGLNRLSLRTTGENGQTFSTDTFEITLGSPDITVNLSWNNNDTDLDLHVFDPNGAHAWFGNLAGIPNGMIDRDDVDGFGPEIFTLSNPPQGTYMVTANSFDLDGANSSTATLEIRVGNSVIFNENYTFTSDDQNAGNGQGSNSGSFWNAFQFDIDDINITRIDFQEQSQPDQAIFTTDENEDEITVNYTIPSSVTESDLMLNVMETNENFMVPTQNAQFSNDVVMFDADHQTPTQAQFAVRGSAQPLTYEVIIEDPTQNIESQPQTITQEERSQIRQEYVDKGDINNTFSVVTPDRSIIVDAGGFTPTANFNFNDFAAYSDYGPGLAVIDQSATIAQSVRTAWGFPVRVTSGFRNPRRNDDVGGVVNSLHQSGDAVDLNPNRSSTSWPTSVQCTMNGVAQTITITSYTQAQRALQCVAISTLGTANYDFVLHGRGANLHLHAEFDP